MEDLLKKVTQYQLFNFLLSGAVLVILLSKTTRVDLSTNDAITTFFLYYFVGLVISRVGSILVEPGLKLARIVKFKPYAAYVDASKVDSKLDTLSQENNTYRTLITTFLLFLALYLCDSYVHSLAVKQLSSIIIVASILLAVLFTFAYRKQTNYITKRIELALHNKK